MPTKNAPFFLLVHNKEGTTWAPKNIEILDALGGNASVVVTHFRKRIEMLEAEKRSNYAIFAEIELSKDNSLPPGFYTKETIPLTEGAKRILKELGFEPL